MTAVRQYAVEKTALGRIVVPPNLPPKVALFYTTRDFDGALDAQRARLIASVLQDRFQIDAVLATCTQVHGAKTIRVSRGSSNAGHQDGQDSLSPTWRDCDTCDALWTGDQGVALGIKVADCLPVTFVEPGRGLIANIHSGWRGAVQRITEATIESLEEESRFIAREAFAWLGPSIRACCFEVGEEVVEQFRAAYPVAERFVDRSRAKSRIDLAAITIEVLRERGFSADRIFDSGLCTRCPGSLFHSFRRDGQPGGRNLAIVAQ